MKNDEKPIANPFVVLREEFDDWAILFDPDTGNAFGLSPTGVYLWKCLDGKHSIDDLLEDIRDHADNVPEDASDHIGAFVDALVAKGLAGLDITEFGLGSGPEKSSSSPPEEVSALKPFTYELPQLVNLSGEQAAYGADCSVTGSQATNTCSTGNLACSCSSGTGRSAICCTGSCHNVACCTGPCNNSSCNDGGCTVYCNNGTTVSNCNTGNTAPSYCAYGGGT
jgi:SynChlorMet cassette protein ScmD